MKYTIYQITNNLNNKIYIGCHKTENVERVQGIEPYAFRIGVEARLLHLFAQYSHCLVPADGFEPPTSIL